MKLQRNNFLLAILLITAVLLALLFFNTKNANINNFSNILLISIDTCRADYLGCYGCTQNTTPNIDVIAKEAFLFENAYSPVPQTLPAHSSMLTGNTPLSHNIHDNLGYQLAESNITLPEILKENGYKTGAIISAFVLGSQFGLDQGFDSYNDRFENVINTANTSERRGDEASIFAVKWLEENKNEKFFLFLHYFDPHFRYTPPEPYASEFADDTYAGEIAYTDHCIGIVIQKLKDLQLYNSTLIILVSDHGEMLGEHGEAEHGYFVYQSSVKVPLIFKFPKQNKSKRIPDNIGIIDIAPTIYSLLNIEPPANIEGVDISPSFSNEEKTKSQRSLYCESFTPTKHNANALLGVIQGDWKYIQTTRPELYNLKNDRAEVNNLIGKEPKRAHLMKENLRLLIKDYSASDFDSELELDEAGKKRLESLGYIATKKVDTSMVFDLESPDPKDFIKFHNIKDYNRKTSALVSQGKLNEAEIAYRQLIEHYKKTAIKHSMSSIHFNLVVVLKKLGKEEQAVNELATTIKLLKEEIYDNPDSDLFYVRLANAYAVKGDFKLASEAFEKALILNPDQVSHYTNLANALNYKGETDKAVKFLKMGIERMTSQQKTLEAEQLKKILNSLGAAKNNQKKTTLP